MRKMIFFFSMMILAGCYYDKENELYGAIPCNTAGVTYSATVSNLLNNYGCLGCHSGASPSGGVNLQGHANVKIQAQNGRLFGAISHSPGFSPMPQGGNKMSACDISRIKAWIDAGAPNN